MRACAHVVVGTPGRVYNLMHGRALQADSIRTVLDEADQMLSGRCKDQIHDIFQLLPPKLQVGLLCQIGPAAASFCSMFCMDMLNVGPRKGAGKHRVTREGRY